MACSAGHTLSSLGANVTLETVTFNAGPSAIEALFAGAIDATYIGPNPRSTAMRSRAAKRCASSPARPAAERCSIVRPEAGIEEPGDLDGKRIATPQLGNTQDVALRKYLLDNGLGAKESGGNVDVLPTANPDTLNLFKQGEIDGAWVPEPWATRLIQEAGGEVFLDERELWPDGAVRHNTPHRQHRFPRRAPVDRREAHSGARRDDGLDQRQPR